MGLSYDIFKKLSYKKYKTVIYSYDIVCLYVGKYYSKVNNIVGKSYRTKDIITDEE